MGSGCGNNLSQGTCTDASRTSSHCVIWQGAAYENLGICTGDMITEVGEVILKKLEDFAAGKGISLRDMTVDCESLNKDIQNTDKSLFALLKLALSNQCGLDEAINKLKLDVESLIYNLDYSGLGCEITTQQQGQQCLIDNVKSLKAQISALEQQLGIVTDSSNNLTNVINNTVNDVIATKITSCNAGIQQTGSGSTFALNFVGIVPPGGYLWGEFDISKFDNTGKGTDIYCGYALANGRNGTIDMRNEVPSMAANIQGVPRTFTDLTSIGSRRGSDTKLINANQLPDHEHNIIDPGHIHTYVYRNSTKQVGKNSGSGEGAASDASGTGNTGSSSTGIQVKGVKGNKGQLFDVRQSTIYQVWIKRIAGFSAVNTQQPIVVDNTNTYTPSNDTFSNEF